jgi:hypothetical protein
VLSFESATMADCSDETVYRLSVYRLSVSVYRYRTDLKPIPNLKSVLYRIHTDFNTDSSSVLESVLYRFKYRFEFGIGIGIVPIQIPISVRYWNRYSTDSDTDFSSVLPSVSAADHL